MQVREGRSICIYAEDGPNAIHCAAVGSSVQNVSNEKQIAQRISAVGIRRVGRQRKTIDIRHAAAVGVNSKNTAVIIRTPESRGSVQCVAGKNQPATKIAAFWRIS